MYSTGIDGVLGENNLSGFTGIRLLHRLHFHVSDITTASLVTIMRSGHNQAHAHILSQAINAHFNG